MTRNDRISYQVRVNIMVERILEESQMPDGSYQYVICNHKSKSPWILEILILVAAVVMAVMVLYDKEEVLAPIICMILGLGLFIYNHSSLHYTFSKSEFVLERGIAGKNIFVYRVPLNEIKKFDYPEEFLGFLMLIESPRHLLVPMFFLAPRFSRFGIFKNAMALRDIKDRQYVVNTCYGTPDERKELTDILNERLNMMKDASP